MAITISKKNKEMTLLQAIERVVELAEDSKMSKEFMKKAKTEIQLLAKSYGITERQAVLFCVCLEKRPCQIFNITHRKSQCPCSWLLSVPV
jgi:hypothetical protein